MWINRNQRAFEWFVELLSNIEKEQASQGETQFNNYHYFNSFFNPHMLNLLFF